MCPLVLQPASASVILSHQQGHTAAHPRLRSASVRGSSHVLGRAALPLSSRLVWGASRGPGGHLSPSLSAAQCPSCTSSDPRALGEAQNLHFNRSPRQLHQPLAFSRLPQEGRGSFQWQRTGLSDLGLGLQEKGHPDLRDTLGHRSVETPWGTGVSPEPCRAWDISHQGRPSTAQDTLGKICSSEPTLCPPHPHFLFP